jgi:hypothetical protein
LVREGRNAALPAQEQHQRLLFEVRVLARHVGFDPQCCEINGPEIAHRLLVLEGEIGVLKTVGDSHR